MFGGNKRALEEVREAEDRKTLERIFRHNQGEVQWEYVTLRDHKAPHSDDARVTLQYTNDAGNVVTHEFNSKEGASSPALVKVLAELGRSGWEMCGYSVTTDNFAEGITKISSKTELTTKFALSRDGYLIFKRRTPPSSDTP